MLLLMKTVLLIIGKLHVAKKDRQNFLRFFKNRNSSEHQLMIIRCYWLSRWQACRLNIEFDKNLYESLKKNFQAPTDVVHTELGDDLDTAHDGRM